MVKSLPSIFVYITAIAIGLIVLYLLFRIMVRLLFSRSAGAKAFKYTYLFIALLFMYAPIIVLVAFSFNSGNTTAKWEGFSLHWYGELFKNDSILHALEVTVIVAVIAAAVSTVLGTLAAIGIHNMRKGPAALISNITYLPILNPDIVTGISLMLLMLFMAVPRGITTMLLAHITFDTPYVIFSVLPKLKQMDKHLYEAALDLGATPRYALRHVIIPEIMPGIVTGALMAFTLSIDDFVISFFTSTGAGADNLSMIIYSLARRGINPVVNAISTLMFICVMTLLFIVNKRSKSELY